MRPVIILFVYFCTVTSQDNNDMSSMPKYDERYDYLDVDAIFTNKRLVRNYVDCLINSNRCTPEGKALKRLLPEALRTKCARCTERQKRTAVKIIKRLKYEYPDEWAKLSVRWDPTGDFTRYFEEFLAKEHFNTIPGSGQSVIPLSVESGKPPPPRPVYLPSPMPPMAPMPPSRPPMAPMPPRPPMPSPSPMAPTVIPAAPTTRPPVMMSTPPRPMIVNRFGEDGELMMGSPSSAAATPRPTMETSTMRISTTRPTVQPKPTPFTWSSAGSNAIPTRFPLWPSSDVPAPYSTAITSTAITIIDQIGYKIIRTTELVTDLLRNTVRAVVG